MSTIINKQIKLIHTLCSKLGISTKKNDRDEYEAMLDSYSPDEMGEPVTSCKQLTFQQANDLIWKLEETAAEVGVWKKRKGKRQFRRPPELASIKQMNYIRALWYQVSYMKTIQKKRKALDSFLRKRFGVDLENLYANQVGKVIRALQAMKKQKEEKVC